MNHDLGGYTMKNFLPLLIAGILVFGGLQAVASPLALVNESLSTSCDELDQEQPGWHNYAFVGNFDDENWEIAQSFVPSKEILTRVELYIIKGIAASYPYVVAIRDCLTGKNLVETSISPQDIPNERGWVEFDFDDIPVIPGHLYYIVSSTTDSEGNYYFWGVGIFDPYSSGTLFYSSDGGETWTEEEEGYDMSFKTYGKDRLDLDPLIKGGNGVNLVIENIVSTTAEKNQVFN